MLVYCSAGLYTTDILAASSGDGDAAADDTPPPEPTPVVNEIGSTGDLKIRASYEDNSVFDDNMAINAVVLHENGEIESIISAVRVIEREQDIFSVMRLSLQRNGRDTNLTKRINIRVEQTEAAAEYRDISVFYVDEAGVARKLDASEENGYISFMTDVLGIFVLSGAGDGGIISPTNEPDATPSLQTGGNTGIIPSSEAGTDTDNEGISETVSPGAFVFWLFLALIVGIWIGIGIGYILWGRYKAKRIKTGPKVIGE